MVVAARADTPLQPQLALRARLPTQQDRPVSHLFGLEIETEENYDASPADEPTARQIKWTQWRDRELIPAC